MRSWDFDKFRDGANPTYQRLFRKINDKMGGGNRLIIWVLIIIYKIYCRIYCVEIPLTTKIGRGLYIGHPYAITINGDAVIGNNCNLSKGVTIGGENRGRRLGAPIIGNKVWIGVNATIVGKVKIGDDVLIAPNSYVNRDIPSHSVVYGNPCIIKHRDNATEDYISNVV